MNSRNRTAPPPDKPRLADDVREGLNELGAYFRGEKTGVKVVRVPVARVRRKRKPSPLVTEYLRRLEAARVAAKPSPADVTKIMGVKTVRVTMLENGSVANPSFTLMATYAAAVGCPVIFGCSPPTAEQLKG